MSKTILTLVEINLLINSEEPKNEFLYGNLYSVLSGTKTKKAISFAELPNLENKAKQSLTLNKTSLMSSTVKEWSATTTIIENQKRELKCELCNTKIKYLFYIHNRKNNKELRVGSECIKKFPDMEGYTEQCKQLKAIHKEHKVVARRNQFYNEFPNAEDIIFEAQKYFSELPILLPIKLYKDLNSVIERLNSIYIKYVNEGKKPFKSECDSFTLFQLAINQYNKYKEQADSFVNKNINNPLICKRREINWLLKNNKKLLLERIAENNGFYTVNTLKFICSYEFIQDNIRLFVSKNQSINFQFKKMNDNGFIISFNKFGYQPPLVFHLKFNDFMMEIGAQCLVNREYWYDNKKLILLARIINSENNLNSVLGYIQNIMWKLNYCFLMDDSTKTLILYRIADKSVSYVNSYSFLVAFSKEIINSDVYITKYLLRFINKIKPSKWITKKQQETLNLFDKIGALYKEQISKR